VVKPGDRWAGLGRGWAAPSVMSTRPSKMASSWCSWEPSGCGKSRVDEPSCAIPVHDGTCGSVEGREHQ
jgi:hypothetical protein